MLMLFLFVTRMQKKRDQAKKKAKGNSNGIQVAAEKNNRDERGSIQPDEQK